MRRRRLDFQHIPHSVVTPAPIIDDTQARIDRIEQRIRSLHVSDGVIGWD